MKKASTLFLKLVICLMALAILALAIFAFPQILPKNSELHPYVIQTAYLFMAGLYLAIAPFYLALYQGWKMLNYIESNTAFSENSVKALRTIKYCALAGIVLFSASIPFLFNVAELDDAPGVGLVALVFTVSPSVFAVFAAVLEKLIKNGLDIKSENDLTV